MRKRMQEQEIVKGRVNFYDFSKTKKRMLLINILFLFLKNLFRIQTILYHISYI